MRRILLTVLVSMMAGCSAGYRIDNGELSGEQLPVEVQPEVAAPGDNNPQMNTPEPGAIPTLTNLGLAPELTNDVWINSAEPLRLADLRGNVVLLEMWTFG